MEYLGVFGRGFGILVWVGRRHLGLRFECGIGGESTVRGCEKGGR